MNTDFVTEMGRKVSIRLPQIFKSQRGVNAWMTRKSRAVSLALFPLVPHGAGESELTIGLESAPDEWFTTIRNLNASSLLARPTRARRAAADRSFQKSWCR